MTQKQMLERARKQSSELNAQMMVMTRGENAITKKELSALIDKRPELWGRFSNWLEVLN